MKLTKGRCQCGGIKFEFEGKPKWVAHCHCESCRRHTSSPVGTTLGVKLEQFRYLEGTPSSYQSSQGVWRYFCPACGSPMAYTNDTRFPGEVHLYVGTLENPGDFPPTLHVNVAEQLPWFEIADDLPRYSGFAGRGIEPIRRGPRKV